MPEQTSINDWQDRDGRSETATGMAPEPFAGWTPRRVVTATLIVLAIAAGFWLVFRFNTTVFLFLVAVMPGCKGGECARKSASS